MLTVGALDFQLDLFPYNWRFCAYKEKLRLISTSTDCKQRSSSVSKQAPTAGTKLLSFFVSKGVEGQDLDRCFHPLTLRSWQPGTESESGHIQNSAGRSAGKGAGKGTFNGKMEEHPCLFWFWFCLVGCGFLVGWLVSAILVIAVDCYWLWFETMLQILGCCPCLQVSVTSL